MHYHRALVSSFPPALQLQRRTYLESNRSQISRLQPRDLVVLELLLKRPSSELGDPLRLCLQERLDFDPSCVALSLEDRKDLVVAEEAGANVESLRSGEMSSEEEWS